jgi:hypothetical protein
VPARAIKVPALADADHLAELAAPHNLAHLLLIRTTQPLRTHLHDLLTGEHSPARQFRILQRIRHRLLAVAILARPHYFSQQFRVLMVAGSNHDGIQFGICEHLLGVFERLRPFAEKLLRVIAGFLPVNRPEVADTA